MSKVFQFKITLKDSDPTIWRRFQVLDSLTFEEFHKVIQAVMGWENYHLYEFRIKNISILGEPEDLDEHEATSNTKIANLKQAKDVKISDYFNSKKQILEYVYDLGDEWTHQIELEKVLEKEDSCIYPNCIEGEDACPPEDCGGIGNYYYLLEVLSDEEHEEFEDALEWCGEDFDPEFFDSEEINMRLNNPLLNGD